MINSEEIKLIEGLINKKDESINLFIDTYSQRLMRVSYMILQDEKLAEDIVQETFIKVLYNIQDFRKESSLYTYLYKIAVNECRQKLRKNWFKRITLMDKGIGEDNSGSFEDHEINRLAVNKCISKLESKYREVITLFYYEDFSINDICRITGEKEGTIKSRLKRARDMLKDILREEGYESE